MLLWNYAFWSLVIGHWSLVIGHWSLVIGHWSLVIGHWSLVIGHWSFRPSPPPGAGCPAYPPSPTSCKGRASRRWGPRSRPAARRWPTPAAPRAGLPGRRPGRRASTARP